jgi:uncharacterized protein (DUF2062 family)
MSGGVVGLTVLEFLFQSEQSVVITSAVGTLLLFGAATWGMGRDERKRKKQRRRHRKP